MIAFLGLLGALTASFTGGMLPWRWAYAVGGGMGLLVLALRWAVLEESAMFEQQKTRGGGQARLLLTRPQLLLRYLAVTAVGVPIWYASALFVNFAPEYGKALALSAPLAVAEVLRWQAVGLALGCGFSGLISEWLRSRKRRPVKPARDLGRGSGLRRAVKRAAVRAARLPHVHLIRGLRFAHASLTHPT